MMNSVGVSNHGHPSRRPLRGLLRMRAVRAARSCITAARDSTHLATIHIWQQSPTCIYPPQRWAGAKPTGFGMSVAEKIEAEAGRDFIRDIVADDLASGRR